MMLARFVGGYISSTFS